jgi:hypothetical protein
MSKLIFLLSLFAITNCVFIRPTNYNETKLNECLAKKQLTINDNLKELLQLYNQNRFFLFEKKCEKMNLDKTVQKSLTECFKHFGIYNKYGDCTRNCHDKCDYYQKGNKLYKRRCPMC